MGDIKAETYNPVCARTTKKTNYWMVYLLSSLLFLFFSFCYIHAILCFEYLRQLRPKGIINGE